MSDRMTSIHLPSLGQFGGIAEYGRKSRAEMIYKLRRHARIQLEEAERILAAPDEEFEVATYVGKIVERNRELVLE